MPFASLAMRLENLCLRSAPPQIGLVFCGRKAMEVQWIPVLAGGRASALFLVVILCSFRVCVQLRKTRRWRLLVVRIKVSPPSLRSGGAYSVIEGLVELCFRWISRESVGACLWWIHLDPVFVPLCSCIFRLDSFDLRFSSLVAVVVLVRWSYWALAR